MLTMLFGIKEEELRIETEVNMQRKIRTNQIKEENKCI